MEPKTMWHRRATVANISGGSTRRMAASRLIVALAMPILLWLALSLYESNQRNIGRLGLSGALIVGLALLAGMKYLGKKGTAVVKTADCARRGSVAEDKVGDFLMSLSEATFVIHDFDSGKGSIDHVLISTKGIFTLDTKSHKGAVYFDGKTLLNGNHAFEKDFLRQALAECFTVRKILKGWGITSPKAEPIILFTNAYVTLREKAKGVEVLSLKYLPRYLERLPDRQSMADAGRIYNRLKAASLPT
jgi:hypothetical protein